MLWTLLHQPGAIPWGPGRSHLLLVVYPLLPWPAVMALGYLAGGLFAAPRHARTFLALGVGLLATFAALRLIGVYGDPRVFTPGATTTRTLISFLNVTKYPASLQYLCLMVGLAFVAVPVLERISGVPRLVLSTFGRVPMFFYIAHLFVLQAMMVVVGLARLGPGLFKLEQPPTFGLVYAYGAWVLCVGALYPACAWWSRRRGRRRAR